MIIPKATKKQALLIIDVQPNTLVGEKSLQIVENIRTFLSQTVYDAYIVAEYFAPESCMMYKQTDRSITKEDAGKTEPTILNILNTKTNVIYIEKTNRSCFAVENQGQILEFLKQHDIDEIHLVGFDINDCVLATLYGGLACDIYTFVLEELTHHHAGNQELYDAALMIFRHHHLTNNSLHPKIPFIQTIK